MTKNEHLEAAALAAAHAHTIDNPLIRGPLEAAARKHAALAAAIR